MGRSGTPESSRDRPKAPSARKRLCSAMPSSTCCPAGDCFHCIACGVSAKKSGRAEGAHECPLARTVRRIVLVKALRDDGFGEVERRLGEGRGAAADPARLEARGGERPPL